MRKSTFDARFVMLSNRLERYLMKAIIIFIASLLLAQTILTWSSIRPYFVRVERLEGISAIR
ncbi:DUF5359 family protein [Brevibacillus laterosporus]|uniref:DUF5359 family protein n=1 Tax=Brevibacillus laterosporus TaxID=1465 RepID=A0AAP3GE33_BRELA|nr:DUF5359 family protein [Brevibacillus laterosporus]ATO51159.1 hypothetical protein BrL25_19900 [Brevibacillus laterosporus DSM 25]AYB38704.1 hypothetical protein D5F52_10740 [Brevibacillus laterosporus]MBG9771931.1 hypothetical protein [Brevibacillus laterosporus]MBG9790893.1 hypothetical protein [Brevibacillus laterosporus]MBG9797454.1 hypothetical protein [Brevibacillus laterosporus]